MSDNTRRSARSRRELWEARAFLRRVRDDFEDEDLTCNLCYAEMYASFRAFHAIAAPGMSEDDLALGVWAWMHEVGPGAWKTRRVRGSES